MHYGVHMRQDTDPVGRANELGINTIQMFLTEPTKWHKPQPHPAAEQLLASDLAVVVHSSYVINVATTNNRLRIPSRKAVSEQATAAAELGAFGLVVHGGHVADTDDDADGFANWRKLFANQAEKGGFPVPILIENTAGGDHAMARTLDAIDRLWDAVGDFPDAGFCLDTCHAWAGGEDLLGLAERVKAITGRIDLVHLNNSRDEFDSGRDRHANLTDGQIDVAVLTELARIAQAPIILETPEVGLGNDVALLREVLG